MNDLISRLLAHERIRAARHHLERTEEITLARQAALSAVPAPTGAEGRRAARVAELFREVGLQDVLIDEVGNVRGWTAGAGGSGKRDGAGLERVVHRALGSKRYHVTFRGPGGHSWAAFGVANPANAVGRAVALLADLPPSSPPAPRTTCAVVRLGGGTGLNSIPQDAWLDLDLRSEDPKALAALDATVRATLERALGDENHRRAAATAPLTLERQLVGDRPSGVTPRAHPLVRAAVPATRPLGRDAELASASTDANVPIALGVAAIALGGGGQAGDAHLATEWYENTDGALGLVRALLVTAAMAEVV